MDWKVIVRSGYPGAMEILLCRQKEGLSKYECLSYENGQQVLTEFDATSVTPNVKPLFSIPYDIEMNCNFSQQLLKALMDRGIKVPDQNFAQGKLEATEKHLEDMRKLVFDAG